MSQVFVLHPSQNISGYFLPYKYSNLTFSKQRLVFSILKEVWTFSNLLISRRGQ